MRRTLQEEPRAEHLLKQKPHKKGQEAWKSASLLKRKIEGLKPQSDKHYVLAWRRRATGGVAPSTPGGAWGRQCGPAQEELGTDTLCDPELYSCVSHSRTLENARSFVRLHQNVHGSAVSKSSEPKAIQISGYSAETARSTHIRGCYWRNEGE